MMRAALFFADGRAFFFGSLLLCLALAASVRYPRNWGCRCLALAGVGMIALSATPLPYWLYGLLLASAMACLVADCVCLAKARGRLYLVIAAVAVCLVAAATEVPRLRMPGIVDLRRSRLVVIADSLSAGMRQGERTWPTRLREDHGWDVVDLSRAGETVESALDQVALIPPGPAIVLLEIGGNDLLGETSAASFAAGLQRLLASVQAADRTLVMCELPLPPFSGAFGRAQRELAMRYGVELIPRRVLANVIGAPGGTLDGLHLSDAGHHLFANAMMSLHVSRQARERPEK